MIRWILDRKWLSISIYSGMVFCLSAGLELFNQHFLGLGFALTVSLAQFASRKFTWFSIPLLAVSTYLVSVSSVFGFSLVFLGFAAFAISFFSSASQRVWLNIASVISSVALGLVIGYQGTFLQSVFGTSASSELAKVNSFLLVTVLVLLLLGFSQSLGRMVFFRIEHIGSPLDRAQSAITTGKLRLEIAKQNERLEIAKDLSELLVQRISAVVSVTEGGRYAVQSDPSASMRILERSYEAGRSAQAELRRLYDYLNSAIISDVASFKISDLNELAVAYRELGFNTLISEQGESFALNEGMELCVYKIVFEALNNVRKHAPVGTEIGVDFLWVEDGLQILVKDNGIEISNRMAAGLGEIVTGYGVEEDLQGLVSEFDGATLAALRDRATIYSGRIEATKVPGVGFTLSAIFPSLKSLALQEN
jgi:signal transduction histidine kinase